MSGGKYIIEYRFDGLGKSPKKEVLPTPGFLPGELHGQMRLVGYIGHGVAEIWT